MTPEERKLKRREWDLRYQAKHAEQIRERAPINAARFYKAHLEERREDSRLRSRARRQDPAYIEQNKVWQKAYRQRNKKAISDRWKRYMAKPEVRLRTRDNERKRYHKNPEKHRDSAKWSMLKIAYKITKADYMALLELQGGTCAICGRRPGEVNGKSNKYLSMDHDHSCCNGRKSCGKCNRGLLCAPCNSMIGMAGESIHVLNKMIAYLQKWTNRGE